jgi:hypothetical protein
VLFKDENIIVKKENVWILWSEIKLFGLLVLDKMNDLE